jgi:hypothetical protein
MTRRSLSFGGFAALLLVVFPAPRGSGADTPSATVSDGPVYFLTWAPIADGSIG